MIVDALKLAEIIIDILSNAEYYQANDLLKSRLDELEAHVIKIEAQLRDYKK